MHQQNLSFRLLIVKSVSYQTLVHMDIHECIWILYVSILRIIFCCKRFVTRASEQFGYEFDVRVFYFIGASAEYEINVGVNIYTCIERCVRMHIYLQKFSAYSKIVNSVYSQVCTRDSDILEYFLERTLNFSLADFRERQMNIFSLKRDINHNCISLRNIRSIL